MVIVRRWCLMSSLLLQARRRILDDDDVLVTTCDPQYRFSRSSRGSFALWIWICIQGLGLRDTMTAPEQECHERHDTKDERADYNPSYRRGLDTGAVRLRGHGLRCRSRGTRLLIITIIRHLGYSFSVKCRHGHTTKNQGGHARGRRLDRKITILGEEDIIRKGRSENIKLVTHAPSLGSQDRRMDRRTTTYEVLRVSVLLRIAYMCTTIAWANA